MDNVPSGSENLTPDLSILPEEPKCISSSIECQCKDVIKETFELYIIHLSKQVGEVGLQYSIDPYENKASKLSRNAIAFKKLAENFNISPKRLKLYEIAQNVDLSTLNYAILEQLLCNILQNGDSEIPSKKVLELFYFCSDLSVRAIEEDTANNFTNIYSWTTTYLGLKFPAWIEQQGGWAEILKSPPSDTSYATRLSILGFCCISVLAIYIYIRNK